MFLLIFTMFGVFLCTIIFAVVFVAELGKMVEEKNLPYNSKAL